MNVRDIVTLVKLIEEAHKIQKEYEELKILSRAITLKRMIKFNELVDMYKKMKKVLGEERLKQIGLSLDDAEEATKFDIEKEMENLE